MTKAAQILNHRRLRGDKVDIIIELLDGRDFKIDTNDIVNGSGDIAWVRKDFDGKDSILVIVGDEITIQCPNDFNQVVRIKQ